MLLTIDFVSDRSITSYRDYNYALKYAIIVIEIYIILKVKMLSC